MYRFLAYALLLHFAAVHWQHAHGRGCAYRHSWHRHNEISDFERLAKSVATAEKFLQNSCSQSPYNRAREFRGADFYTLKYNLQEFSEDVISVKVKSNVVSVKATHPNLQEFKDLRILPRFVNINNADWYFDQGVLTILFPYKNPSKKEVALTCDKTDDTAIDVPKQIVSPNDLKFGTQW